ncbi:DUF2591 domain-containing protein [Ralstonia sp. TCR112]|uniref:phage protein NinX family protein n=1 Tax=Ralstonia sp. TCR112 TaxID=2601730 RepID=UPI0011BE318E|nr:phage protein NinX family protein [Ralstonia sp. TCR112]TXD58844.1 DUF2591 domain-containing protein [Ralstonia sp. TCR112]
MLVEKLGGALLDYWVARAMRDGEAAYFEQDENWHATLNGVPVHYSTDWAQAGPILENESISTVKMYGEWRAGYGFNVGTEYGEPCHELKHEQIGKTPLQAAMRAYVASKFGDEVPDMADAQSGSAG